MKINQRVLNFFSMLADETRLKILVAVSKGPMTVNDIHKQIEEVSLSAISHQLKQMHAMDIVVFERKGRRKYYSLSDNYCWCILRDAFSKEKTTHRCKHCAMIEEQGGLKV